MTYSGIVKNGVIVLEEGRLPEGVRVQITPLNGGKGTRLTDRSAFGLWRDREDLGDTAEASRRLRQQMERRQREA